MTLQNPTASSPPEAAAAKPRQGSFLAATLWTLGGEAGSHSLRVVSSLILTRLLFPEAFGLMAVVQVFMQGLNMFSDLGIRPIIIRHPRGDDPDFLNTIWTVRLIRGAILAAAFCALAWPVSVFYERAVLASILPVASLNLFLEGFQSTKIFSNERRLHRARLTVINFTTLFAGIVFMIVWAWIYRSVWALVWGGVVGSIFRVILSHVALPGPGNRFHWDKEALHEVAHFGKWVFLNSMVTFLAMQLDKLVFAKLIDMSYLGIYAIAVNIVALPTMAVRAVGTSVIFPAFSQAKNRQADLRPLFDRMRLFLLFIGGAGISFLIFNGPWLITLLYDARYEEAGWILQVAAFGGWFIVMEAAHGFMLLTLGQPRWQTVASGVKILAWVMTVPLAFKLFKFPGALVAAALVEVVRYTIESYRVRKSGMTYTPYERGATLVVLACGAAAYAIHGPWKPGSMVVRSLLSVLVFSAVWGPIAFWYWKRVRKTA